jgi:hypothetical protein
MSRPDFIPTKDRDFLAWMINFLRYLFPALGRLNFPPDKYQELSMQRDEFASKLETAEEPATRTKTSVQAKNDARRTLEKNLRALIKEYLSFNHALTNEDRDDLGLPIPKASRTPAPVADTYPGFRIDSSVLRLLIIHFFSLGGASKAKPPGQHGVEIKWVISETPVINIADLLHSAFDTRSPYTLEFTGDQRGKTVYIALCWENTRGEKGPWSDIVSAIIP